MIINILTCVPEQLSPLSQSVLGRAQQEGVLTLNVVDLHAYSDKKHRNTDDYPFGGGVGMLMMPQPIFDAYDALEHKGRCLFMSPRGKRFDDSAARRLAKEPALTVLCGHYEGVDQRVIDNIVDEEISMGDYILTGGELPAMLLVDAVSRYVPGVLGSAESAAGDSFGDGLLEGPQYTRPADFRGMKVPDVLLEGNHALIAKWQRQQQLLVTKRFRPDLLATAPLSKEDKDFLSGLDDEK